jgi:transposase
VLIVEKTIRKITSLKSIPGIGGYLASVILAECGDLRRFNNEGQFSSYIGLVPEV